MLINKEFSNFAARICYPSVLHIQINCKEEHLLFLETAFEKVFQRFSEGCK